MIRGFIVALLLLQLCSISPAVALEGSKLISPPPCPPPLSLLHPMFCVALCVKPLAALCNVQYQTVSLRGAITQHSRVGMLGLVIEHLLRSVTPLCFWKHHGTFPYHSLAGLCSVMNLKYVNGQSFTGNVLHRLLHTIPRSFTQVRDSLSLLERVKIESLPAFLSYKYKIDFINLHFTDAPNDLPDCILPINPVNHFPLYLKFKLNTTLGLQG